MQTPHFDHLDLAFDLQLQHTPKIYSAYRTTTAHLHTTMNTTNDITDNAEQRPKDLGDGEGYIMKNVYWAILVIVAVGICALAVYVNKRRWTIYRAAQHAQRDFELAENVRQLDAHVAAQQTRALPTQDEISEIALPPPVLQRNQPPKHDDVTATRS